MKTKLLYVELQSGHSDNGPAWIGLGTYSKSGSTIYFNSKGFQSLKGGGIGANYFDVETGDQYWISGVKKNQQDRHRCGSGIIMVDRAAVADYLAEIGAAKLDERTYRVVDFTTVDPKPRINARENDPDSSNSKP